MAEREEAKVDKFINYLSVYAGASQYLSHNFDCGL